MTNAQFWFLQRQEHLAERVGEPVLLTIRMRFDDWFEVKIQTFTDRWGMAADRDLEIAVEGAAEMLLEMEEVVDEVQPSPGRMILRAIAAALAADDCGRVGISGRLLHRDCVAPASNRSPTKVRRKSWGESLSTPRGIAP